MVSAGLVDWHLEVNDMVDGMMVETSVGNGKLRLNGPEVLHLAYHLSANDLQTSLDLLFLVIN